VTRLGKTFLGITEADIQELIVGAGLAIQFRHAPIPYQQNPPSPPRTYQQNPSLFQPQASMLLRVLTNFLDKADGGGFGVGLALQEFCHY